MKNCAHVIHFITALSLFLGTSISAQELSSAEADMIELDREMSEYDADRDGNMLREDPVILGPDESLEYLEDSPEEEGVETPEGMVWVEGHEGPGGTWESGYWRTAERSGFEWIPGGYGADGEWLWGGWLPDEIQEEAVYQPGFVDEDDLWNDGFWRPMENPGHVWVEGDAPSAIAPQGHWVPTRVRRGHVWVAGHVGADGWWNSGFWRSARYRGHVWIEGQVIGGVYHYGHWEPLEHPQDMVWVPGHVDGINWVPGHFRLAHRPGHVWVETHRVNGVWFMGFWASHGTYHPPVQATTVVYGHGSMSGHHAGIHIRRRAPHGHSAQKGFKLKTYKAKQKAKAAYKAKQKAAYKAKQKAAYKAKQKAKAAYKAKQKAKAVYKAKQKAAYKAKRRAKAANRAKRKAKAASRGEKSSRLQERKARRTPGISQERSGSRRASRPRAAVSPTRGGGLRGIPHAQSAHRRASHEVARTRKASSRSERRESAESGGGERRKKWKRPLPAHRHGAKAERRNRKRSGQRLRISRD